MNMWEEQHETTAEVNAGNLTNDKNKSALQQKKENSGEHHTRNGTTRYEAVLLDGTDNDVEPSLKSHSRPNEKKKSEFTF